MRKNRKNNHYLLKQQKPGNSAQLFKDEEKGLSSRNVPALQPKNISCRRNGYLGRRKEKNLETGEEVERGLWRGGSQIQEGLTEVEAIRTTIFKGKMGRGGTQRGSRGLREV